MKLGPLKAAIRSASKIKVRFSFGSVPFEKTALLEALSEHFAEGKAQETNLKVTEDGHLQWEPGHERRCRHCDGIL